MNAMPPKGEKKISKKSTTKRRRLPKVVPLALPKLPTPVVAGPVMPPKPPRNLWVYFLIVLFSLATIGILTYVILANPFAFSIPGIVTEQPLVETTQPPIEETPYSYLSVVTAVAQADHYLGTAEECSAEGTSALNVEKPTTIPEKVYFNLTVRVDALSEYETDDAFRRDLARIGHLIDLANKHRLKVTLQLQSPFVETALRLGVTDVSAWVKQGHEVALMFDEESQFSSFEMADANQIPYGTWLLTMHKEQVELEQLCGCSVTSFAGGGDYDRLYSIAEDLSLVARSGWVNADGTIPADLVVTNPWIPADSGDLGKILTFDPFGSIVYLPSGVYPSHCSSGDAVVAPFTDAGFTFTTKAFYETLEAATKGKVNVFRVVVDPADFGDVADDEAEFTAWNTWLTSVIDPVVRSGKLVGATDAATATAFVAWLDQNIGKIELK